MANLGKTTIRGKFVLSLHNSEDKYAPRNTWYKYFSAFSKATLKTPKHLIHDLGWSDGYNACGYSTQEWGTRKHGLSKVKTFALRFQELHKRY